MFGRKKEKPEAVTSARESKTREDHGPDEAEALMQQTLRTLDQSLALKREAREKTQRFVGSLRPLAKAR